MKRKDVREEVIQAALKWAQAIGSGIAENVIGLYHPDASLWGTLSPSLRHGHKAMREYFLGFLDKENLKCEFIDGHIRNYGDFAFYSGSYVFTWVVDHEAVRVPARFSFVYKKVHDQWLIMEHHSSLFPELPFQLEKYTKK